MTLEVEVRYRHPNPSVVIARLEAWGAVLTEDRNDVDQYFNAPDRDLKASGEAFRIRTIGPANFLTYKGPRRDSETKTRQEIEVPLGEGETVAAETRQLFLALGYRPVVIVRKKRQIYALSRQSFDLEVCFDTVEKVGSFIEMEILAKDEQFEEAKRVLLESALELGLTEKENRSYLAMVLEAAER